MRRMRLGDIVSYELPKLEESEWHRTLDDAATLRLPETTLAEDVAHAAADAQADLVVSVDPGGRPRGLLSLSQYLEAVQRYRGRRFETFASAVHDFEADPDEQSRGFHHEWLNQRQVQMYRCPRGHYTTTPRCPTHPEVGLL